MQKETTSQDFSLPLYDGLATEPRYQELVNANWTPTGATVKLYKQMRLLTVQFERSKRNEA